MDTIDFPLFRGLCECGDRQEIHTHHMASQGQEYKYAERPVRHQVCFFSGMFFLFFFNMGTFSAIIFIFI